jgi:hypothetical protein
MLPTMTARALLTALALAIGLCANLACSDKHCDIIFDPAASDEERSDDVCTAAAMIVDCLREEWGKPSSIPDEEIANEVRICRDEFRFCTSEDPEVEETILFIAEDKVRGLSTGCPE